MLERKLYSKRFADLNHTIISILILMTYEVYSTQRIRGELAGSFEDMNARSKRLRVEEL